MVRLTLKILQHLLQDFQSVSAHFEKAEAAFFQKQLFIGVLRKRCSENMQPNLQENTNEKV